MYDWPHAPPHKFNSDGAYFITARTYMKRHYYTTAAALDRFVQQLFALSLEYQVALQAWAIFSNHYHLVANGGAVLQEMLARLHSLEGRACNSADGIEGRQVWFQYRDTKLTFEKSWLARLKYTHENAVKHRLVMRATDYRWCSASWFERVASGAFRASLVRMNVDRVNVDDDFDVMAAAAE